MNLFRRDVLDGAGISLYQPILLELPSMTQL
jgi:hypothetical protein